jgi:spore coat protein CotH
MAAAVVLVAVVIGYPSLFTGLASDRQPDYVKEMDKTQIMDIQIVADEAQWAELLETATEEEYIPCTVIINGEKIKNVGIRAKGNSSLSTVARDDTTDRYSFKLEFDHYVKGQNWQGLDKLAINNMQGDASYMKEYLSYDILNFIGVNTPLYAFADISVNDETWGFYLAVECLEDSYIDRYYGSDHGQLYKPESMGNRGNGQMNAFLEQMNGQKDTETEIKTQNKTGTVGGNTAPNDEQNQQNQTARSRGGGGMGGGMSSGGVSLQYTDSEVSSYSSIFGNAVLDASQSDYQRVITALEKISLGEDLESYVDAESVLRYLAGHTVVVNLDSYVSSMAHNYYLYEEDGRLSLLPWDYNLAFGGFQSGSAGAVVNFPIDTPVSGVTLEDRPIIGKLLENAEYLELYHGYLRQIVDGYFNSGIFAETVVALDSMIGSHVQKDPSAFYTYEQYQAAVPMLMQLGLLRAQSIEGQLDGTIPSTTEGQNADASALVDASGINLSTLGSQGGGGMGGAGGRQTNTGQSPAGNSAGGQKPGGPFGAGDQATGEEGAAWKQMRQAMEIIAQSGDSLTDEQRASLLALGLTEAQIEALINQIAQGGFAQPGVMSGMGGRQRPGGQRETSDGFTAPERQGSQAAPNTQGEGQSAGGTQNAPPGGQGDADLDAGTVKTASTLIFLGLCAACLLAGLIFIIFFRRRHPTQTGW